MHLVGIENVVAVLGTALTKQHINQLSRYTESKQIILNFDADKAGLKATKRAIKEVENLVYNGQVKLKVLNIPNGKDADEFLQSGDDAIKQYQELINNAPLWLDWQIEESINNYDLSNSADFELAFQSLVQLINKISNDATKNYYLSHCAEVLSQKKNQFSGFNSQELKNIYQSLQLATKRSHKYQSKKSTKKVYKFAPTNNKKIDRAEFILLVIYLHCLLERENIVNLLEEKDLVFSLAHHRFLWQQIHQTSLPSAEQDNDNYLLRILQENMVSYPEYNHQLNHLFNLQENDRPITINPSHYITSAIACLEAVNLEIYEQYYKQQISQLDRQEDRSKINSYYQEILEIKTKLKQLAQLRME